MLKLFDRMDPTELTGAQFATLEALMPLEWPALWQEFATSLYITLVSAPGSGAVPPGALANLAMQMALGLAADHAGTQIYVPTGAALLTSSKARRVIELLDRRMSYRDVAKTVGLTEPRVRRIESDYRRQQWASRQRSLPLDDSAATDTPCDTDATSDTDD